MQAQENTLLKARIDVHHARVVFERKVIADYRRI